MFCNGVGFGSSYGGPKFFMMIPMILIILMVVYLMHKAISSKNIKSGVAPTSSKALTILDERFAKGEINEEEYISKKNHLQ